QRRVRNFQNSGKRLWRIAPSQEMKFHPARFPIFLSVQARTEFIPSFLGLSPGVASAAQKVFSRPCRVRCCIPIRMSTGALANSRSVIGPSPPCGNRKEIPMLAIGDTAPDFTVNTHEDEPLTLSSLRGKKVVLWFYPKASTPG